jgi:acetyl/propionyl-CoA carboxylase alpha subunit
MRKIVVNLDGQVFTVEVQLDPADRHAFTAVVDGEAIPVTLPESEAPLPEWAVVGRRPYELIFDADLHWLQSSGRRHHLEIRDAEAAVSVRPTGGDGRVKSPIPGLITRVLVEPDTAVVPGQPLLILEAMKMENEIRASRGGTVREVHVQPGQSVARDALLVDIG